MDSRLKAELLSITRGRVVFDPLLNLFTTLRVGGPAWALVEPESQDDLQGLLTFFVGNSIPYFVIGNGSNLLVSDSGFSGIIITLERSFSDITFKKEGLVVEVETGAGVKLSILGKRCARMGYSGIEFLHGIPGTVGGATRMNAGAFGRQIEEKIKSVEIMTREGEHVVIDRERLNFTYRKLEIEAGAVILGAVFDLCESSADQVALHMEDFISKRSRQPKAKGSAGSIFKNPPGDFAGRIIEKAGLKGIATGGARIAREHANWIVTDGNATALDVFSIIEHVQKTVEGKFGIVLEPEIQFLGFVNR